MGLIQNKVTVSQPISHVVVKNAGGLKGATGETGPAGQSATIAVGTTTTLPAGASATVQNSGTSSAAVFNFGIPKGDTGEDGASATVAVGSTTTLPAGSDATVENVGTTSDAIFNFGIPKGDTGSAGASATVTAGTTTTLPAGASATVTNSGTSSAAVFDFGIPKGDTGDTGPAGADGYSPTATVTKSGDTATITITDKNGTTTAQVSDGTTPTIDPALSPTSENPVQNKVVTNTLAGKQPSLQVVQTLPAEGVEGTEYFVNKSYDNITGLKGNTQQITYSGKNLFQHGSSFSINNTQRYRAVSISGLKNNTTYEIQFDSVTTNATSDGFLLAFSRGSTQKYYAHPTKSGKFDTFTTGSDGTSLNTVYIYSSDSYASSYGVATTYENLMIAEGNTRTDYEPYVGGTASPNPDYPQEVQTVTGRQVVTITDGGSESQEYEINLGKNILDNIGVTETKAGGITFTVNADKSVTVSGVATGANWFKLSDGLQLDGDYFLSGCPGVGSTTTFSLQTSFSGTVYGDYGSGVQLHAGTTDPVWIVVRQGQDFSTPVTFYPQIEKGTSKSSYAPYFTPIELCKIGTYQDYIYKSGEDWYIKKNVGKQNMSALSGLSVISTGNFIASGFSSTYGSVIGTMLSNIFTYSDTGWEKVGTFGIAASGNMWAMTGDSTITTANISTWLSDRNAVVYYELSTPTDTQITDAALIAQLEAVAAVNIKTTDTTTVTSEYLPAILVTEQGSNSYLEPYVYYNGNFIKVE